MVVDSGISGALTGIASFEQSVADARQMGDERLDGVVAKVYEGVSRDAHTNTAGQRVRMWRDERGRLLKMTFGRMGEVAMRYDAPEDARLLEISEQEVGGAQDADRAMPALEKLTSRPAVVEKRLADREVKVHEAVAGENGDLYVAYSVQLTPEAAKVLRFTPAARSWGRGYIVPPRNLGMRQFNAAHVAFIHEQDRSLWWVVLTPAAAKEDQPWMLRLNLTPAGWPNGLETLREAGLGGFGTVQLALPQADASKRMSLDEWLKHVSSQVGEYSRAAAFQSYRDVQPLADTEAAFLKSARGAVENARSGGSQGVTSE
jgi:hypothetical protein